MKRFYRAVTVGVLPSGGFAVYLDGRPIKTPGKAVLALPQAHAEALAEEWRGQGEDFDPAAMTLTRCANTALDRVRGAEAAVADALTANLSDLLCYRAPAPEALVERQNAAWSPLLDWACDRFGARLTVGVGAAYVEQPPEALARLRQVLLRRDAFALTALAGIVAILGSLVLALALAEGRLTAEEAYGLSRLDETFQNERWGTDAEAEARSQAIFAELTALAKFLAV